ncbi:MAG TPA: protein kinase, partial [Pyrinomonadaceae bacterium]|nr:protein kinase [Pyrinomonadaceae bacterium]
MDPNRWRKIESVLQSALDLPAEERDRFLAESCAGDAGLKDEVERLLAEHEEAGSFLESPAWADERFADSAVRLSLKCAGEEFDAARLMLGRRVGAFRLTGELGRGGMGAVYLAERTDGEFRQRVAVKLIKRGMDTDEIVRRFRHERQVLAAFDHPHIARLFDGGTTDDGLPFFVMEYVEGEPLYEFCDGRRMTVGARLELFQRICSAVAHAHDAGVVHRDIKPGNVMVTRDGDPKLLDFGIAKILDPALVGESLKQTATMMRLMTPEYASPEQVRGLPITPASDIYALGVMLYELLTGRRPYSLDNRALHELTRVVCEDEPELPSLAITKTDHLLPIYASLDAPVESIAGTRGVEPEALRIELTDNLDRIILKALAKLPTARYAAVREFSDDIERHLSGADVLAERPALTRRGGRTVSAADPPTGERSIAVLPFSLLNTGAGEDTGDKFLGLGLADALIAHLSNIRRLAVRPTSSVLRYSGDEQNPPDLFAAGRELGVRFVLHGLIQSRSGYVRVSVQLVSVAEHTTVWAGRFDEDYTDLLALEDALSNRVAQALVPRLTTDERDNLARRGTDNPRAFEAYLRGRYLWNTFTEESFARAIEYYREAVALDPQYALAYVGIAEYYVWVASFGVLPPHECYAAAKEAASKAVALSPELAEAHSLLGQAVLSADFDWARAHACVRRAVELNPYHPLAHSSYAYHLYTEGLFEQGLIHARRAIEIDPLSPHYYYCESWGIYFARRFEEAVSKAQQMVDSFPASGVGYVALSFFLRRLGRYEDSVAASERARELLGESLLGTQGHAQALASAGKREEAYRCLKEIEEMSATRFVSPYSVALIYCALGEKERALSELERAYRVRDAFLIWLGAEPALDILRDEPRFQSLLRSTGNPIWRR